MAPAVPVRITWAVEVVDPSPGQRILELGVARSRLAAAGAPLVRADDRAIVVDPGDPRLA